MINADDPQVLDYEFPTPLEVITNSIGMQLIAIRPGEFDMGARDGEDEASDAEKPRHRVQITRGFLLGRYEVTQGEFEMVMGFNPSDLGSGNAERNRLPVEMVSWYDAIAFCNKLSERERRPPYYRMTGITRNGDTITKAEVAIAGGDGYRLPTEAEWEYAARAGTKTIFPWGDSLSSEQANFDGNYPYGGAAKGKYRIARPRWGHTGQIPGGCMIRRATFGNGSGTGTTAAITSSSRGSRPSILPGLPRPPSGSCGAAAGSASAGSAGRRTATGSTPATGAG